MRKFQFKKRQSSKTLTPALSSSPTLKESLTPYSEEENSLQVPEILPGPVKSIFWDNKIEVTVPNEVSILPLGDDEVRDQWQSDTREAMKVEVEEYRQQLQATQKMVDKLTTDLKKTRLQASQLLNHNGLLLEELKAAAGKDDATSEEHRLLKQELYMLKACLFLGALFICCGGRADVIGIAAFVWVIADVSS